MVEGEEAKIRCYVLSFQPNFQSCQNYYSNFREMRGGDSGDDRNKFNKEKRPHKCDEEGTLCGGICRIFWYNLNQRYLET